MQLIYHGWLSRNQAKQHLQCISHSRLVQHVTMCRACRDQVSSCKYGMKNPKKTRAVCWLSGGTFYDNPASPERTTKAPKANGK